MQTTAFAFAGILAAVGPLAYAFGTLLSTVGAIGGLFTATGTTAGVAAGGLAAVAAGLSTLTVALGGFYVAYRIGSDLNQFTIGGLRPSEWIEFLAAWKFGLGATGAFLRSVVIALIAFLSLVDLFATQAILPLLTAHYGVTPGQMGFASNISTLGMLISGLAVGYFSASIDRRLGILVSLVLLAIPTALLAYAPNLTVFAALRIVQGLCMAAAFTLTLAYLGEHYSARIRPRCSRPTSPAMWRAI